MKALSIFCMAMLICSIITLEIPRSSTQIPQLTDQEILQQTINGVYEENKLTGPTTIVSCFDDASAHDTVAMIGTVLDKAAKGSLSDLKDLKDIVQKYSDNLPKTVKECLDGIDFSTLGAKYGITNTTDPSDIEKKVISYITLHYLTVHKWFGDLDKAWRSGKYYDTGFALAGHGHEILKISNEYVPTLTDAEILQQTFNGLYEQNKLPDPTTIVKCFDDASAHSTVAFIGTLLDKAAKGSISDLLALKDLVQKFGDTLPQAVKDCLSDNAELKTLLPKYGITDKTDPSVIEKKVITYLTLHYLTVHKWLGSWDSNWNAGKYYQVGYDIASSGHTILGMSRLELEIEDVQEIEAIAEKVKVNFEKSKNIYGKLKEKFLRRH